MKLRILKLTFGFIILYLFNLRAGLAQVRLPALVGDGMVLQRDTKVKIWGWASPAEKITVKFNNKTYKTITDNQGKWLIILPALKAGGPFNLDITASNHINLKNILVGDVWFCSGQSNMVFQMNRISDLYPEEIANANYPQIRNFFVPTAADVTKPHDDYTTGKWIEATPATVLQFGAVSYFFSKQLYHKYKVPIGIINSSVDGTPIQAWISATGIKGIMPYAERVSQFKDTAYLHQLLNPAGAKNPDPAPVKQADKGLTGNVKWYEATYVPQGWLPFWLPGYWADQGVKGLNGVVWFRKEIEVPAAMARKAAKLYLGRMTDADETFVNGIKVGNQGSLYAARKYDVPADLLEAGKNIITIRLTNNFGKGGFIPEERYELTDGMVKIDLRGDWQYKVGLVATAPVRGTGFPFSPRNEITGLYNTMVAPAINYTIKGFMWYQGESNTGKPTEYNQLLPALITDWRTKWQQGNLPFLYVQLPNYLDAQYSPSESQWAELREAQLKTLTLPNTGMAVTIDVGQWNDIHPLNKKDVGERLALQAHKIAYGNKQSVSSGPIFQSAQVEEDKIIINFEHTGSGLIAKGGEAVNYLSIAGADKKFVWADARIEGDKVIVSSKEVPNPKYVRYAWADNPVGANLYNKEGLPASPFRTDK